MLKTQYQIAPIVLYVRTVLCRVGTWWYTVWVYCNLFSSHYSMQAIATEMKEKQKKGKKERKTFG